MEGEERASTSAEQPDDGVRKDHRSLPTQKVDTERNASGLNEAEPVSVSGSAQPTKSSGMLGTLWGFITRSKSNDDRRTVTGGNRRPATEIFECADQIEMEVKVCISVQVIVGSNYLDSSQHLERSCSIAIS